MTHNYSRYVSQDLINITCSISFFKDPTFKPKRCNGINKFFVANKKVSYFLVDMVPRGHDFKVHTNNQKLNLTKVHSFHSASLRPNARYVISHFLTLFFKTQRTVPNRVRNRTFNRLRILLLNQWNALQARLNNNNQSNRSTKSFIRFSYKKTTYYLGFYMPCSRCPLPAAKVLSEQRSKCHIHDKFNITTPKPPPQPDHMTLNTSRAIHIVKRRLNIQYGKCIRSYQSIDKRFGRVTFFYDLQHIKEEIPGSPMYHKYSRRRLKTPVSHRFVNYISNQHSTFCSLSGWKIHDHSPTKINNRDFALVRGNPPTIESRIDINIDFFFNELTNPVPFRKKVRPKRSKPPRPPLTPAPRPRKPPPKYLSDLIPYVRDNNLQQLLFEDYDALITQFRNDNNLRPYTDIEKQNPFWEVRERTLKRFFLTTN